MTRADARRNREKLVAAAAEVIAAHGPDASLEEIARRAGVGSATLHRNFPSRADLLESVLRDRVAALHAQASSLLDAADAGAGLVEWMRAVVAHAATARGLGPALAGYGSGFSPHDVIREAAEQLLSRAQREGAVESTVTVDDVLQLANGVSLAAEGLPGRADALMLLVAHGLLRR